MNEELAAVCSKCNQTVTGKIYDTYWCSDCKLKELEEDVKFYKEQYDYAEKERSKWLKQYNDESILKTKYRHAFEVLFEQINKK